MTILKTLRGHWKKSVFGAVVVSFGCRWCVAKYRDAEYMRHVCLEARQFGDEPLPVSVQPRHVTVVLNPSANRGKSVDMFERWCAPLLHLAGLKVAVVRSEQPGEVSQLLTMMDNTDAVIIAGGNGTVVEAVTGLMRRPSPAQLPVAIVPLGSANSLADRLWGHSGDPVRQVTAATMAAIRQNTAKLNVLEISPVQSVDDGDAVAARPVFAACSVHWGAIRDTLSRVQQYWYWGVFRRHAAYFFTAFRTEGVCWDCSAELDYVPPCPGCRTCAHQKLRTDLNEAPVKPHGSWWSRWLKTSNRPASHKAAQDRLQRMLSEVNLDCGKSNQICITTTDFKIENESPVFDRQQTPCLTVGVGPRHVSWFQFVVNGWNSLKDSSSGNPPTKEIARAETLTLLPVSEKYEQATEQWISIDGEPFELKPMHVRLMPEALTVFV